MGGRLPEIESLRSLRGPRRLERLPEQSLRYRARRAFRQLRLQKLKVTCNLRARRELPVLHQIAYGKSSLRSASEASRRRTHDVSGESVCAESLLSLVCGSA